MISTFLSYMTFTDFNQSGLIGAYLYANYIIPFFTPMVLFVLAISVFLLVYFGERATLGVGNPWIAFATATTIMMFVASIMALKKGMINITTLGTCFAIWIASIIMLFSNKDRLGD